MIKVSLDKGEQIGETKGEIMEHLLYCVKSNSSFFMDISFDYKVDGVECWKVYFYKKDCNDWYGCLSLHLLDGRLIDLSGLDGLKGFDIVFCEVDEH